MSSPPQLPGQRTGATRAVLALLTLLTDDEWTYGMEIAEQAGYTRSTVRTVLARLEAGGWCVGRWESEQAARTRSLADDGTGRHIAKRRYYRLTPLGRAGVQGREMRTWLAKG